MQLWSILISIMAQNSTQQQYNSHPTTNNQLEISLRIIYQQTQICLILSCAITIHKSQGIKLDEVVVDIGEKENLF